MLNSCFIVFGNFTSFWSDLAISPSMLWTKDDLPDPIFVEATADDGLHEMMSNADYDLLAIGAHSRLNAGRYFLGSLAAGLIRKPPCDLLIAK